MGLLGLLLVSGMGWEMFAVSSWGQRGDLTGASVAAPGLSDADITRLARALVREGSALTLTPGRALTTVTAALDAVQGRPARATGDRVQSQRQPMVYASFAGTERDLIRSLVIALNLKRLGSAYQYTVMVHPTFFNKTALSKYDTLALRTRLNCRFETFPSDLDPVRAVPHTGRCRPACGLCVHARGSPIQLGCEPACPRDALAVP